eukprot:768406-Hanusia_phi.AAC.1
MEDAGGAPLLLRPPPNAHDPAHRQLLDPPPPPALPHPGQGRQGAGGDRVGRGQEEARPRSLGLLDRISEMFWGRERNGCCSNLEHENFVYPEEDCKEEVIGETGRGEGGGG